MINKYKQEPISYNMNSKNSIPKAATETLNSDGVVCIRNAINQNWLDVIEQGIDQALSGSSTNVDIVKREGDQGSFSFS